MLLNIVYAMNHGTSHEIEHECIILYYLYIHISEKEKCAFEHECIILYYIQIDVKEKCV